MKRNINDLKIKKVDYLEGLTLKIIFSDDSVHCINFQPFLERSRHPEIRKYLRRSKFKEYKLTSGELMWGDFDLIFPIADLYRGKIEG